MTRNRLVAALSGAVVAASLASPATAQSASESDLAKRLDQLAAELAKVKAELAQLQQQRVAVTAGAAAASASAPAGSMAAAPDTAPAPTAQGPGLSSEPATVLTSYGEINYNRPTHDSKNTVADLRRFVLGYQHRFDEKTKVVTELEVEHAVSSSSDRGEVEVEQAYIERQLTRQYALRGGLFLMPAGLLNENHEPTAFYGVERNFVETAIIPSTWREGGIQIVGNYDNGLTAQAGITTGFDLNKWDATSTEGAESPLGSIHQELQLAKRARPLGLRRAQLARRAGPAARRLALHRRRDARPGGARTRASRCGTCMRAIRPAAGTSRASTVAARSPTPRPSMRRWSAARP